MLIMIDGQMINRFIDDVDSFRQCTNDRFCSLDGDGDGFLSRSDFQKSIPSSSVDQIFDRFDADGSGGIDREEFRPLMMELLIAIARGFGGVPVNVGVESDSDSLLLRVYEHDLARIERDKEEKEKAEKQKHKDNNNNNNNNNNELMVDRDTNNITGRKLRKKRTRNIFGLCSCSPKFLGENGLD